MDEGASEVRRSVHSCALSVDELVSVLNVKCHAIVDVQCNAVILVVIGICLLVF